MDVLMIGREKTRGGLLASIRGTVDESKTVRDFFTEQKQPLFSSRFGKPYKKLNFRKIEFQTFS